MTRSRVTKRELQIIKLIAKEGLTSAQMAEELNLSARTIDAHRANVMTKLDANSTGHLISICYDEEILKIKSPLT